MEIKQTRWAEELPGDVWADILRYFLPSDWKYLRLICKTLQQIILKLFQETSVFSKWKQLIDIYFQDSSLSSVIQYFWIDKLPKKFHQKTKLKFAFPVLRTVKFEKRYLRPKSTNPPIPNVFMFEIKYEPDKDSTQISAAALGIVDEQLPQNHRTLPGWPEGVDLETGVSVGYHSDDGSVRSKLALFQRNTKYECKPGEVMGVVVDFDRNTVFFTKDGSSIDEDFAVFSIPADKDIYGCVGGDKVTITVNIGETPFMFDLKKYLDSHNLK